MIPSCVLLFGVSNSKTTFPDSISSWCSWSTSCYGPSHITSPVILHHTLIRVYAPLDVVYTVCGYPVCGCVRSPARYCVEYVYLTSYFRSCVVIFHFRITHFMNRSEPFGTVRCCKSSSIRQQTLTPFWTPPETSWEVGVPAGDPRDP